MKYRLFGRIVGPIICPDMSVGKYILDIQVREAVRGEDGIAVKEIFFVSVLFVSILECQVCQRPSLRDNSIGMLGSGIETCARRCMETGAGLCGMYE